MTSHDEFAVRWDNGAIEPRHSEQDARWIAGLYPHRGDCGVVHVLRRTVIVTDWAELEEAIERHPAGKGRVAPCPRCDLPTWNGVHADGHADCHQRDGVPT